MSKMSINKQNQSAYLTIEEIANLQSKDVDFFNQNRNNNVDPKDLAEMHTLFAQHDDWSFTNNNISLQEIQQRRLDDEQNKIKEPKPFFSLYIKPGEYSKEGRLYWEVTAMLLAVYKTDIQKIKAVANDVIKEFRKQDDFQSIDNDDKSVHEFALGKIADIQQKALDKKLEIKNFHGSGQARVIEILGAPGTGKSHYLNKKIDLGEGRALNDTVCFELDDFRLLMDRSGDVQRKIQGKFQTLQERRGISADTAGALSWEHATGDGMQKIKAGLVSYTKLLFEKDSALRKGFGIADGKFPIVIWDGATHASEVEELMDAVANVNNIAENEIIIMKRDRNQREEAFVKRGQNAQDQNHFARFPGIEGARKKEQAITEFANQKGNTYSNLSKKMLSRIYFLKVTSIKNDGKKFTQESSYDMSNLRGCAKEVSLLKTEQGYKVSIIIDDTTSKNRIMPFVQQHVDMKNKVDFTEHDNKIIVAFKDRKQALKVVKQLQPIMPKKKSKLSGFIKYVQKFVRIQSNIIHKVIEIKSRAQSMFRR